MSVDVLLFLVVLALAIVVSRKLTRR